MKTAIVTGAAQGIGYEIARFLAEVGMRIAIVDVNEAGAAQAAQDMPTASLAVSCDVSDAVQVDLAVQKTFNAFGHVDVLVNNAGVITMTPLEDISLNEWNRVLGINLTGTFLFCQAVIPFMQRQGTGKIINIASSAGQMGGIAVGLHYSTSKAGMLGMTKSLARILAPTIQVNAIAPGTTESEIWDDETERMLIEKIPAGRLGKPSDIAAAVRFLTSDEASFITGQTLSVNGGLLMV